MLSERLLLEEAKRRRRIHAELPRYLKLLLEVIRELDPQAEAYLFGSIAEGRGLPSSDIDVLIVTDKDPEGSSPRRPEEV